MPPFLDFSHSIGVESTGNKGTNDCNTLISPLNPHRNFVHLSQTQKGMEVPEQFMLLS
jgi:hypothetical protein